MSRGERRSYNVDLNAQHTNTVSNLLQWSIKYTLNDFDNCFSSIPHISKMCVTHHHICRHRLPAVYSKRLCQVSMWGQLGVSTQLGVHSWRVSISSYWIKGFTVVETIRNCVILKKRQRWLGRRHRANGGDLFLFTFVILEKKASSCFLAVFSTSILKPNLK